jgi:hypothetical protein
MSNGSAFLALVSTVTVSLLFGFWIDHLHRESRPLRYRPQISLQRAASLLRGGDVILTRGHMTLTSTAITMAQRHEFTHVAIVLKDPASGSLYILSSNDGNREHAETELRDWRGDQSKGGIRIFDFFQYVKAYTACGGNVYVRALDPSPDPSRLWNIGLSLQGIPYPSNPWVRLPSAFLSRYFPYLFDKEESALHCAATVARTLGACDVIRPEAIGIRPCYQWIPRDFADDAWIAKTMTPAGYTLRPIVHIVVNDTQ